MARLLVFGFRATSDDEKISILHSAKQPNEIIK